MFTRLTCKGLDICPLPTDVRDSLRCQATDSSEQSQ